MLLRTGFVSPLPALKPILSAILALSLAVLLTACRAPYDDADLPGVQGPPRTAPSTVNSSSGSPGIGGTGEVAGEGNGIGGTGNYATAPGIGGTGVVGAITGFGSIFVNGYEIDYTPNLPVTYRDGRLPTADLRVGQVVAVEAAGEGKRLRARTIAVRHEVAGPIESIDADGRNLSVMGQRIALGEGAATPAPLAELKTGQHIEVSGSRREDGLIVASRLDRSAPGASSFVRGRITAIDSRGFRVNGLRVTSSPGTRPAGLRSGQEVSIAGRAAADGLRARRIAIAPRTPFGGRVSRLSIEGFARVGRGGTLVVGGVPLRRAPGAGLASGNDRIIMEGALDRQGRIRALKVRPAPLRLQPRRAPSRLRRQSSPPVIRPAPQKAKPRIWRQNRPNVWRSRPSQRWQRRRPANRPAR
jgi:hypothetical protein